MITSHLDLGFESGKDVLFILFLCLFILVYICAILNDSRYSDEAGLRAGWSGVSIPGWGGVFFYFFSGTSRASLGPTVSHMKWVWAFFSGGKAAAALTVHLVPRLRMSGAIPTLPLYSFMAWTRKTPPGFI
jgi:hypothetical protein